MKRITLCLGIFLNIFLFAQDTSTYTTVTSIPDYAVLKTKMKLDDVVTKADVPPEYPGGKDTFKKTFAEKMDVIDVKSTKISTTLYFIVEKTGYVRYVKAISDNKQHAQAAEVAIRRMFVKWKPATINGEPVRYLYSFPLTLKKY